MNFIGLIIGIIVGIMVLFISKWMILANLLIIPLIMSLFVPSRFKCPECGYVQKNAKLISKNSNSHMTHGRRTSKGDLDKRFNSSFSTTYSKTFGIECSSCDCTYKVTR